jgi:long-chain fatty acid transport protein
MSLDGRRFFSLILWLILMAGSTSCPATNGLNLIGYGAESIGMGGADLAVARDTSAIATNPAGLSQIQEPLLNVTAGLAYALDVSHHDRFGNDEQVANNPIGSGSIGFADRLGDSPLVWGVGLFAQGGAGVVYEDIASPFGTKDDLSSLLRIGKLSSSLAWAVDESLSLGATLEFFYSDLEQEVFPETSFADPGGQQAFFFGSELRDLSGVAPGLRIGVLYRLNDRLSLGIAYSGKAELVLNGGTADINMSAIGLGKVRYRKVEAKGIDKPQELGVGVAWQATDSLLLALDLSWIDWSDAVRQSELRLRKPDNPLAPQQINQSTQLDWRDQYVLAVGFAYDLGPETQIRGGYNYGRNPIPRKNLSPLLAPIVQHHFTLGAGRRLSRAWRLDAALEYDLYADASYDNPELPFGPGSKERTEVLSLYLELGRRW